MQQNNMKKIIINIVAALAIGTAATAQSLSVADVDVVPGTTASYSITINVGDGEYSGFQYEIAFPATGFSTPDAGKSTVNASWEGGSVNPGALTAGAGKVSVLSMQNVKLPAGDFAVGTISFSVDSEVPLGTYDVTITNIEFLSTTTRTSAPDVTFKVSVVDKLTIVLDENSTELPATATDVNVSVKRTINANEWGTICLPFAMNEAQVKAAFGDDVQLGDFTGYETEEDVEENIVGITVNFNDVSTIEANHPYVIKTSQTITEFAVNDVDIDAEDEPTVATVKRTKKQWSEMIGTNAAKTVTGMENCLFLSGGKFWYAKGDKDFKAFRGYFDFYDVMTSVEEAGARINISFDGTTTGIGNLQRQKDNRRYYNLKGQQVEHPAKGLYITNGQKVVMK